MQNHRRCGRRELLVDVVVAIRGDANRVGFVEIEMDRSLARVVNRRRDRLEVRRNNGGETSSRKQRRPGGKSAR